MTALALATFDSEGAFLRARLRMLAGEHRIVGEWLPYASDALGPGSGERGLRAATIGAGLLGGGGLFALTIWSTIWAYPLDSGGRPLFSWPAFVPAAVEFSAVCAAFAGLFLLFLNGGLTRLHHSAFDFPEVEQAAQDRFVLAVACDAGEEANAVLGVLASTGAEHSRLVTS